MRLTTTALWSGLLLSTALPAAGSGVDAKLLDMLLANGSITPAQHAELSADLAREQAAAPPPAGEAVSQLEQKLGWAMKTQIKGDVRVRHESIEIDETSSASVDSDRTTDRQRVRARIGAVAQVNPEVEAGIRIASGNSADRRSTNQDLGARFDKKELWLDLAYIDWHPEAVPGVKLIGGKMAQPWESTGDVIWDGDINPEGAALAFSRDLGGAEVFGSAGIFTLFNNVDGEGNQFEHDLNLWSGQLGASFAPAEAVKITLGGSVYGFHNDEDVVNPGGTLALNGNTSTEFMLYEGFGAVDIEGLPLPLSVYGQFVRNSDANGPQDGEDTAWLAGVATKLLGFSVDYNYRDVQRNAVVGAFTDSDFAAGFTASRGHKIKLKYDLSKNFSVGATYFMAESDAANAPLADIDVDTLQIDFEAKI